MSESRYGFSGKVALLCGGHTGIGPILAMRIMMN